MEKREVKQENRKALPKFILIILGSAVVGGLAGFFGAMLGVERDTLAATFGAVLPVIGAWGIPLSAPLLLGGALVLYLRGKRQFAAWDGEDEPVMERVEEQLSIALMLCGIETVLCFFFMTLSVLTDLMGAGLRTAVSFLAAQFVVIFLQQRLVDLTKKMNPEKRGSVYDTKFQKKWMESCDEAEQMQVYRAAFSAHQAVTVTGLVLWVVLLVSGLSFGTGTLAPTAVLILMGVQQVTYCVSCIRQGRRKKD